MPLIKVGFDLDGVIAQHTLGGFWFRLRKLKEKILKKTDGKEYYYPKSFLEKAAWLIIDWCRPPLKEKKVFCALAKDKKFQFFLITGRFKFLDKLTRRWLDKHGLTGCFEAVIINNTDLDPRRFKAEKIKSLKLDYFIDDERETVRFLRKRALAKIFLQKIPPISLIKLLNSWLAD